MPTSPSRRRGTEPQAPPPRLPRFLPLIAIGVLVAAGALIAALPAAVLLRVLPSYVRAADLSGTIWHGVAAKIAVDGDDAGEIEWRLHPAALLHAALHLDLHWRDRGLWLDADAHIGRAGLSARRIRGGGPLADLGALAPLPGWSGDAEVALSKLNAEFSRLTAIAGNIQLSNLASPTVAGGANIGNYLVHFDDAEARPGEALTAQISDVGGPLQVRATLSIDARRRRGMLTGTLIARPAAPAQLRSAVAELAKVRGRDATGRVPLDVEFTF
ncbi:MAG TPA: type II secretion system protein N [Steroidobacteraceae bacterium]|nr:type II secretion system protein N [Steroidobacteraceae bacterium]